ncbi:putative Piezo non-specific cation channel, R-Ras-binding domain containing protein [Leishmania utingensis]|uniref:Piezo non-specific cation channel, R-Ras-binding domain containing protein n=1 Tax=Leishmania utingensis TaxID=653362 RepID=A0AAW2ZVF2_9TRYP
MTSLSVIVTDGGSESISPRHVAALHALFLVLATISTITLRAPVWLIGALFYCSRHRRALVGRRLFPSPLWQTLLALLVTSTICNVAANVLTTLQRNTTWVQKIVWQFLFPVWALLGVQQWDARDYVNTMVCPGATTVVLGAYLLILRHTLSGRVLSRSDGTRMAQDRSMLRRLLSRWEGTRIATCRLTTRSLLFLFSWVTAWTAEPSVIGLCLEGLTFVFAAVFLHVEHHIRQPSHCAVRNGPGAKRHVPHIFGTAVAVVLVFVCATQNTAFLSVTQAHSDWCRLLGIGPAALDTVAGLRYAMQMLGMAGVFLGATAMHHDMASSESPIPESSAGTATSADGVTSRLLPVGNQRLLRTPVSDAPLPSMAAHDGGLCNRQRSIPQVVAIVCLTAILGYAVYYPSLVSTAMWLLHLCCCAGGLVQRPLAPPSALRIALACVLAVLCCMIFLQYVYRMLAGNPRTAAWGQWPPAKPAYPDDGRAVGTQVVAEHLIALLCGVYVTVAGVDDTGGSSIVSSTSEGAVPAAQSSSPVNRMVLSAHAEAHPADSVQVTWLRAQLRDAAANRRKLRELFGVAVGRSPRTVELDAICAAAVQELDGSSPAASRGGLTAQEVTHLLASGPFYTYAVILCMFVLGTSSATIDFLHATCLVVSLGVSVIGSNAVLYRRVRTVPPVWVAIVVGVQLCYSVFTVKDEKRPQQQQQQRWLISAVAQPSFIKLSLGGYAGLAPIAWGDRAPYLYAQLVLLWCSRYTPKWLTDWTHISQCLTFRCRWARFLHIVHQVAGVVVLAWIALLLPRSASVTVLILLLFAAALLQHLRCHKLAYVWRRFLVVGYCGVVLMSMLTAEFAPVQPWLWKLLHALGCPPGSEGRCAQDIGLPADSATWLTPLSIPWWLVIVLATATTSLYPLPSSLPPSPDAASATGVPEASTARCWRALVLWPQVLSDVLSLALLVSMVHTAVQRPRILVALYLVGPGLGIFPCWTFGLAAVHAALQCAYQLWFSPAWLDTQTRLGLSPAELIGLWRPSFAMGSAENLPPTLVVAAAPLLVGAVQSLQLQCALQARWRARNMEAAVSGPGRMWSRLRRTCATHLYLLLLWVLLYLAQKIALGWLVGLLVVVVWVSAEVRDCGVLQRRRWLYGACASVTAALMALAYVLHWLHAVFPSWSALAMYPWLLGGAANGGKTGIGLRSVCCTAAAACAVLRVSSGAPRDGESEQLFRHSHGPSFIDWLRGRSRRSCENREGPAASLSQVLPDEAHEFFRDVADVFHCAEEIAEEADVLLLAPSQAPPSKGSVVVSVARLVPLVACGSIAVGSAKASPPCVLSVALLLAGLCLAMRHAHLHWSFWRWWRLTVILYALLPLIALVAACPCVRDVIPTLPAWVGLLIGLSQDASHVDSDALVFSHWQVMLFSLLWLQSCVYNCPGWCAALLRQHNEERRMGETRHAALQRQLLSYMARAAEEAVRVDREIRSCLDALRAGDNIVDASLLRTRRGAEYGREEDGDERGDDTERVRVSIPSPPPRTPVAETEELDGVLGGTGTWSRPSLLLSGAGGRSDAAATSPPSSHQPQPSRSLWWRQQCVRWLRRLSNQLAAYTYHPSEYRLSVAASSAATADSSVATLWQLGQRTVLTAVQVVLRHTPLGLLGCLLVNSLLTGCLWELIGLCYVVQVALAYHPYAPRVVYKAFGVYLIAGVLLKEAVTIWTFFDNTDSFIITVLSWTLLPLKGQGHRSSNSNQLRTTMPSSRGALRYDTLWMDVVTMGVLVLHDRMCIIHGVYVEQKQGSREHDSTRIVVVQEGLASSAEDAPPSTTATAATTALPGVVSLLFPTLSHATSSNNAFRAFVIDYCNNLLAVPGIGEDWYIFYTSVDFLALIVVAVFYSRIAGNDNATLQDNVQNNLLPGPMALLLCMSVLQLVMDRMLYVQRCMRLKALANGVCAISYTLLYWWWRNAVAVSGHAAGNTYFVIKVVGLVLSVTQVCHGFPVHRCHHISAAHLGSLVSYSSFMVYRSLPFLWEVRTLVDWTVLRTSLTLQEYLTVEDIYVYIYRCRNRYLAKHRNGEKLADAVPPTSKWAFGVSYLALVLLALLGPLLYYSTYNPSTAPNSATLLNFQLSFFGAYDFFSTTVHDNVTTPEGWWTWIERTRPTLGAYRVMTAEKTVQLMEFTSCSSSLWMASPQAIRQVLASLRAAASNESSAYILQTLEISRNVSGTATAAVVSLANRWSIPWGTAQDLVDILEQETSGTRTATVVDAQNDSSGSIVIASASLPFFYSPFAFNRASRIDGLPTNLRFPHRNQHNCTLELNHDKDVALNSLVRYWCLHCAPLFPEGNVPSQNVSDAAEWRCLTTGEGCDDFNYEDVADGSGNRTMRTPLAAHMNTKVAEAQVPMYMVVISDTVVMGISFLKGIGIVALYTTLVLALGRLLRSVLANQASTLLYSNMANPAVLENMVRWIEMAREYGDLKLEHTIYLEFVDLLRSAERLFRVTGSLRCMYADTGDENLFRLGQVRRRDSRRNPSLDVHEGAAGEGHGDSAVSTAVSHPKRAS